MKKTKQVWLVGVEGYEDWTVDCVCMTEQTARIEFEKVKMKLLREWTNEPFGDSVFDALKYSEFPDINTNEDRVFLPRWPKAKLVKFIDG